ncbi:MAG: metalloregulator ArsR/SmtB family transcription factor [Thermomicrobiales bacterium]
MYWRNILTATSPIGLEDRLAHARFTALADPTRLAILTLLRQRDQCVCHLVEALRMKQSIVSYHIAILRRAGLITSWPHPTDRRWLYYTLDRSALEQIAGYIGWLTDEGEYDPDPLPCAADGLRGSGS